MKTLVCTMLLLFLQTSSYAQQFVITKAEPPAPASKCYIIQGENCSACERLERDVRYKLFTIGWKENKHIEFIDYDSELGKKYADRTKNSIPQIVVLSDNRLCVRIYGYLDPAHLATILNIYGNW